MAFDVCIPSQLGDFFFSLNTTENNQACLNEFKIQCQLSTSSYWLLAPRKLYKSFIRI